MPVPSRRLFNFWPNANDVDVCTAALRNGEIEKFADARLQRVNARPLNSLFRRTRVRACARRGPGKVRAARHVGGVPHEHVLETGLAVGCESDQIDFAITSSVCDDLKRDSYLDNHILEKLWLHHSASQFLQFFLHGCCGKTSY
jgi:hypothetical protein